MTKVAERGGGTHFFREVSTFAERKHVSPDEFKFNEGME